MPYYRSFRLYSHIREAAEVIILGSKVNMIFTLENKTVFHYWCLDSSTLTHLVGVMMLSSNQIIHDEPTLEFLIFQITLTLAFTFFLIFLWSMIRVFKNRNLTDRCCSQSLVSGHGNKSKNPYFWNSFYWANKNIHHHPTITDFWDFYHVTM